MNNDNYIWPQSQGNGLKLYTNDELLALAQQREKDFFENLQYWKFNPKNKTLIHIETDYEVDLERFTTQAKYLDWIMHIHRKKWITVNAFAEYVTALSYLIDCYKLPVG